MTKGMFSKSNPHAQKNTKKGRAKKQAEPPPIPKKILAVLGRLFDAEVARKFNISNAKAKAYREQAGIPPVCKPCRLAERKGKVNECPIHSDIGQQRRAEESARVEAAIQWEKEHGPTWEEKMQELERLTASSRKHADAVDELLRRPMDTGL